MNDHISSFFKYFGRTSVVFGCLVFASQESLSQESGGFGLSRFFRLSPASRDHSARKDHDHDHDHDHETRNPEVIARVPSSRNNAGLGIDSGNASQSFQPAVTSPGFGQSGSHRITARVSQSGPVTEADPILTRVGLGRSDSGSTFGLFLQVYADGTVIDSEGVHHLSISQIRQVLNVIRGHDFSRIKGHCGQPSADFVENVQMIVYDRSLGRLRAHPFSYSGNPDGCDDSVAHLHKAVEDLVLQIAGSKSGAGPIVNEVTNDPSENMGVLSQTFSGSSSTNVGLPQVIEQPAQAQAYSGASSGTNYAQGTVVPRLPTTSISPSQPPTVSGGGLPSLNPPR